ncbi:hypothetical protein CHM34_13270 [Paludifilum halophilum]|uniref:Uncharacterized protein n=1 Tax=Paludifilum halophilum TaxID=1642702 RepID=A0A235B3L7_9BACL|nr:hypothetical protein CHM34_13270 [Paludifilum halophilum]
MKELPSVADGRAVPIFYFQPIGYIRFINILHPFLRRSITDQSADALPPVRGEGMNGGGERMDTFHPSRRGNLRDPTTMTGSM